MRVAALGIGFFVVMLSLSACGGGENELLLGATTTVQDTGLVDALIADFEDQSSYRVKPIVQGSGQILAQAREGEFDVIMTHSPADEKKLVADGYTTSYQQYMQNFFEIVGPEDDPAGMKAAPDLPEAFRLIAASGSGFISRGDGSGTNKRELDIWAAAGIEPQGTAWYQESAAGQGQNILIANDKSAYTLTDSSTFTTFKDKVALELLQVDEEKPNVYSVLELNKDKLSKVNVDAGRAWAAYLTSDRGQALMREFGTDKYGEALFQPLVQPQGATP